MESIGYSGSLRLEALSDSFHHSHSHVSSRGLPTYGQIRAAYYATCRNMSCSPSPRHHFLFVWPLQATIRTTAEVGNGGVLVVLVPVVMHTIERHASFAKHRAAQYMYYPCASGLCWQHVD